MSARRIANPKTENSTINTGPMKTEIWNKDTKHKLDEIVFALFTYIESLMISESVPAARLRAWHRNYRSDRNEIVFYVLTRCLILELPIRTKYTLLLTLTGNVAPSKNPVLWAVNEVTIRTTVKYTSRNNSSGWPVSTYAGTTYIMQHTI